MRLIAAAGVVPLAALGTTAVISSPASASITRDSASCANNPITLMTSTPFTAAGEHVVISLLYEPAPCNIAWAALTVGPPFTDIWWRVSAWNMGESAVGLIPETLRTYPVNGSPGSTVCGSFQASLYTPNGFVPLGPYPTYCAIVP
jgi:hypothetical protein